MELAPNTDPAPQMDPDLAPIPQDMESHCNLSLYLNPDAAPSTEMAPQMDSDPAKYNWLITFKVVICFWDSHFRHLLFCSVI